ncbi:ABC transporter ATP-binding protein [Flavobacterium sp. MAHUQ-51]|uniref:ABC transporter ATP-binding protein n=1 Tax=Flavobacterium sp. GCM10022190 TaxID=3252639 RepID=UPI003609E1E9
MKQLAIKAENISKQYRLGEVGTGTISHDLNRFWHKIRGNEDPYLKIGESNDRTSKGDSDYVWSLRDINFEIEQGDAVGIIGRNGAGKSTLFKLLSKVTKPTTGSFKVNGRIASLLEVGTGFNPEMTGRENIYLNGAILGMRRAEITRKFDEIVDFAGVERYIDTPVKRYSSGMYVRLAFAVAAHLESEILIVDEVLAVGDAEFQKKCLGKMGDVSKGEGRTVLFVSHNMGAIKALCNKGILLANGQLKISGEIDDVVEKYRLSGTEVSDVYTVLKDKDIYLREAKIIDESTEFYSNEDINFSFEIQNSILNLENVYFLVRIMDADEQPIFSSQCLLNNFSEKLKFSISKEFLVKGFYHLSIYIYKPGIAPYDVVDRCCDFTILNNNAEFAHLETFNVGKVYNKSIKWNNKLV